MNGVVLIHTHLLSVSWESLLTAKAVENKVTNHMTHHLSSMHGCMTMPKFKWIKPN